MAVLVVAAHDNKAVRSNVANAVTAAGQMGSDVTVLVAGSNAAAAPDNLTVSIFSKTGPLLRVAELPNLHAFANSSGFGEASLYATGPASALLVALDTSMPGAMQLDLQSLDDTPAAVGPTHVISLPTSNALVATAWDGQRLWVTWQQPYNISGDQLMLQAFDAAGTPLAPAQVLDSTAIGAMGSMHIAGDHGTALLTWLNGDIQATRFRYAAIADPTTSAQVFTLGARAQGYTGSYNFDGAPVPVLGAHVAALTWRGPQFSFAPSGPLPEDNPRGVLLDAQWQPVRSATGSLDDEALPLSWARPGGQPLVVAALGNRLVFAGYELQQSPSYSASLLDMLDTSFLSPGNSALATAAASATLRQAPGGNWSGGLQSEMPATLLLWPDRALVVGRSTSHQATALTQVWLN